MEGVAKLLGDHRKDLERWFDGEISRLNIVKEELFVFHDDMAKRVLAQVEPKIGSDGSISHVDVPLSPRPCQWMINRNVPAPPAPIAHAVLPSHSPTWGHDDVDGKLCLPGTVLENGSSNSAQSVTGTAQAKSSNQTSPPRETSMYSLDRERSVLSKQPRRSSMKNMKQNRTFIDKHCFKAMCAGLILFNAVFLGFAADKMLASAMLGETDVDLVWEGIQMCFCACFVAELMLRLVAGGWMFFSSKNDGWWNLFDTVLVVLSLMDTVLTMCQAGKIMNFTFARIMRLFRFIRILRVVRVMRFFYSFRLMMYSVIYSILSLLWVFGMLLFFMYLYGMFLVQGITEHFRTYSENNGGAICETALCLQLHRFCGDVASIMLSLFMSICGGMDWREFWVILRDVRLVYGYSFIFFIFFMVFGVLNVVVGIFVQQASLISQRDRELIIQSELEKNQQYYDNIRRFFQDADVDGSGSLSWQNFRDYLGDETVQAYFQSFELDVTQARTLFALLDLDESGEIDLDEFVEGCMRMRGRARSIDVHMLLYENEKMMGKTKEFMKHMEEQLYEIRTEQKQQRLQLLQHGLRPLGQLSP